MIDNSSQVPLPPRRSHWFRALLLVALAAVMFAWFLRSSQPRVGRQAQFVSRPAPEIVVEGWLNGPGPTAAELAGKVYVIEAWAYWCGPCLQAAPHTVELYDKYKERGVVFIGLTSEGRDNLKYSREFVTEAKFSWPCGYGAGATFAELYRSDSMPIPRLWVVNKQGHIVWGDHPMALEGEVLEELLKE